MSDSRYCKYCPNHYTIFWDDESKRFYNDPDFTIVHKKHNTFTESNDELKQVKKIQKSLLMKVYCMNEDLKIIKDKLGLNDVR